MPAATDDALHFYDEYGEYGFAGLSVQSVGYTSGAEEETVNVYITRGNKRDLDALPTSFHGVGIQAIKVGKLTVRPEHSAGVGAHGNIYERNGRIACGSSCAPAGETYSGTFGALVRSGGQLMALSNNHVFAACNQMPVGQPILSPSAADAGPNTPPPRQLCRHHDIIELRSGTPDLVPPTRADVAVATVPDDKAVSSWQGDDLHGYDTPTAVIQPSSGLRVKKTGRTTGLTFGTVEAFITAPTPIPYKMRDFAARVWVAGVWIVRSDPDGHFALLGDSGSLVVTEDGAAAVGLLFACTMDGLAYIVPMETVTRELSLHLVGQHGI